MPHFSFLNIFIKLQVSNLLLYGPQILRHYTLNSIAPELNLEKLQLIATAKASPASKMKWLEYFNAFAPTREACKLPTKPTNEEKLQSFLSKACFWEGVSTNILMYP